MRKSLSLKMLIITFGSFLLLIFGITASLYLYFDKFYEPIKINHTLQAINEFSDSYDKNNWDNDKLYSEVFQFMKTQNVAMSIRPQANDVFSEERGAITTKRLSVPYVLINEKSMFHDPFDPGPVFTGNFIGQPGIASFKFGGKASASNFEASVSANINGKFVVFSQRPFNYSLAASENKSYEKSGISYTISTFPNTNYREVIFTKKSTVNDKAVITDVSLSLQSVSEVTDFLLGIFPYLIAAAVLLSIIMVFVYSRTISKPIVSLTKTANRMANMEFGIISKVSRRDELGELSASLNTLSGNLKTALSDLSQANVQLKEDYENELRQEQIRKEFIANASHELKTPLGIIKSYTEGIRDGVKAEKRNHYMEVILDEISRMDLMIKEMLEISKLDAGAVKYNKQAVHVDNLLKKVVNSFEGRAAEKCVSIQVAGEFGTCLIDEDKIKRVLNNLIENAVKYCDSNSSIRISSENCDNSLIVKIENDCPNFSDEVLEKIWDRFYKADTSHNRDIEGTGLGLAITKSILEGHGCEYGVYNTDKGVCFYFTLQRE